MGRVRGLYGEVLRRQPHGLISWRYLWPGADERIRLHRRLWWNSGRHWPRVLWCVVEGWLWLRWLSWSGWRAGARTVRLFGPVVAEEEGIALWRQRRRVLRLALGWCVSPVDVYRFRLYRRPDSLADYVFGPELAAYHRWRSEPLGLTQRSLDLLQDKVALADRLTRLGIPVVPTVRSFPRGSAPPPLAEHVAGIGEIFCKGRYGNQGRNAFAAWRTAEGLAGLGFEGEPLDDTRRVERAWRDLLRSDDALIQPRLANHPALPSLTESGEAITVRLITQWDGGAPSCLDATLEVPAGRNPHSGRTEYTLLPLGVETGELQSAPPRALLTPAVRAHAEHARRSAATDRVPDWAALLRESFRAHSCFPDVRAIAWDWVVTPEGPVLLEGNSGWGVAWFQVLHGGLLRGVLG